jgi:hypothetical protein
LALRTASIAALEDFHDSPGIRPINSPQILVGGGQKQGQNGGLNKATGRVAECIEVSGVIAARGSRSRDGRTGRWPLNEAAGVE